MIRLSAQRIKSLVSPVEVLAATKQSLMQCARGNYQIPQRMHIEHGPNTFLVMPALGPKYMCTKIVSVHPDNPAQGLPLINGTLQLVDARTGKPLAEMDAPMITALRTAAIGTIAMDCIVEGPIEKVGIIGTGVQAFWQAIFVSSSNPTSTIFFYSRNQNNRKKFWERLVEKHPEIKLSACKTAEEVVEQSEVIYTCTTSSQPVFSALNLSLANKRFISMGSFRLDMQELPDEVYQTADAIIIDSKAAMSEVGDVQNAIRYGFFSDEKNGQIYLLEDVISGNADLDAMKHYVFKSVGMAAFDLGLASALYEKIQ